MVNWSRAGSISLSPHKKGSLILEIPKGVVFGKWWSVYGDKGCLEVSLGEVRIGRWVVRLKLSQRCVVRLSLDQSNP